MIQHPDIQRHAAKYSNLPKAPLRVIAHLTPGQHIVNYESIHLDALLASTVVREAMQGAGVPDSHDAYDIPLPLKCLWRQFDSGLPLWASTDFFPAGHSERDSHSLQKRPVDGRYSKPNTRSGALDIVTIKGRHMARMMPTPATSAGAWEAQCIGHAETVLELLTGHVTHLGKHRARGFGEVARWEVAECESFSLHRDGKTLRPFPFTPGWERGFQIGGRMALIGWTPPQWKPSLFSVGWATGSAVQ